MTRQADGEHFFYSSADGLRLHARIDGNGNGQHPVVCLPGLTRNARDFSGLARFLSSEAMPSRQVVAFDYRGRGRSDYDPDWRRYNILTEAEDVLAGLAALGIERAAFVGTSRGGLVIHLLAAMRPTLIEAVVLNDVGPELGTEGLRQIKSYLEKPRRPANLAEAVALQKATHGRAFPALSDVEWGRFTEALYRQEEDGPVLDFDPALIRTVEAIDLEKPLPDLWPQFERLAETPLLAIRGEHSRLLTEETLHEMHRRDPDMQSMTVSGQGHAPLLDTGHLPARIAVFLASAAMQKAEGHP